MQLRAAAAGLLLALLAGQTVAASFDCSKASSFPEKAICRDGYLSGLDDWLARSYKTALEVNPDQDDAVRQSQREWLATGSGKLQSSWLLKKQLDRHISRIRASRRPWNSSSALRPPSPSKLNVL
ncbi:lysozyme inhibitor LprI family protein [Pseudomonas protegens]|uniref:lysozyme inhibitor LprI family protein n=1 Tax=Pseudomonas protegens TaxID=380021 RepID=UPI003809F698